MKTRFRLNAILCALFLPLVAGCSNRKQEVLILWTDNVEFASYAELFNSSQQHIKIATVYKQDLINNFPVKKGGAQPDIIAGSWIAPGITKKLFSPVNSLFSDTQNGGGFRKSDFYPGLLQFGAVKNRQYLLPVSFNLGTFVFDHENARLVNGSNTITTEQIKECSKQFNKKAKNGLYEKMAFAPQWNPDFLCKLMQVNGAAFSIKGSGKNGSKSSCLEFSEAAFKTTCDSLIDWTNEINSSYNEEKDFAFKYLYTPFNKQVLQQKSLFAYTTSDKLFSLSEDQLDKIDFRWFVKDGSAHVKEDIVMMGICRKSKNKKQAKQFIKWFMNKDSQEQMLKRRIDMNLDTNTFGIANGFSSLAEVNEKILPVYYKYLLAKIPSADIPAAPSPYPPEWPEIKREIIIPHIQSEILGNRNPNALRNSFEEWVNSKKEE